MLLRDNLRATNGLTKYPSIVTYHALGERGRVTDAVQVDFGELDVLVTEKVDGTNARIIVHDGDYLIGSREELLHARGDCIHNPAQGIVDAIRATAEALVRSGAPSVGEVLVVYGEVYGGKVTAASKSYTSSGAVGFRVFDVVGFSVAGFTEMRDRAPERIAAWREGGGQRFLPWTEVSGLAGQIGVHTVPVVATRAGLPKAPGEALGWMRETITSTHAGIDAQGRPEGLVVRTEDRAKIAKLRFEDYERGSRR